MLQAEYIDGDTWMVSEISNNNVVLNSYKVAVRAGGTGDDAIAAVKELQAGPTEEQAEEQAQEERTAAIKAECRRRILAVVNETAQVNMASYAAAGFLDAEQMATYVAGVEWIAAMRAALPTMPAYVDYLDDSSWVAVPDGVADMAAAF